MVQEIRTDAAEHTYNRRWLVGVVGGPLLLGFIAAGIMFALADRLPEDLASHWGDGDVDGYSSLLGLAGATVFLGGGSGALLAGIGVVARGSSTMVGRVGVGFGLAFGVIMTALFLAIVVGQVDSLDASQARISAPVMWIGVLVALAVALGAVLSYSPGDVTGRQSVQVVAAHAAATDPSSEMGVWAQDKGSHNESLTIRVSLGPARWLLALVVAAATEAGLYFVFPVLALVGLPVGAAVWILCGGTVVVAPSGTWILAGGFWKLMTLGYPEIRGSSVQDIRALEFGGWGYRMNIGDIGFIMGDGPALVLETGFHQRYVISLPDALTAGQACALVNVYRNKTQSISG